MPIKTIEFLGRPYPALQAEGFASQYAFPFAKKICFGVGLDIGCMKRSWALPGAIPIDLAFDDEFDAMHLPQGQFDYIFSSHCLEHIPDYVAAVNYWKTKLRPGGVLFLYLPHEDQDYWLPWHNRKHRHAFNGDLIRKFLYDTGWKNIHVTDGYDLNHSFYAIAEA